MQYMAIFVSTAVLIIVMFALTNILRKIKKLQGLNVIGKLQSEISELILELNLTTDRNLNIMEDKISSLTKLLYDADKRIKILGTEFKRNKTESIVYNQLGKTKDKKTLLDTSVALPAVEISKKDRIIKLHNNGFTTTVIASKVGSTIGEVELIISLISS